MFQVQRKPCPTCIYRPGSPLDLQRLEAEIADPHLPGFFVGWRVCHHNTAACCSGFWRRHKDDFTVGQLAQRFALVAFVEGDRLRQDG